MGLAATLFADGDLGRATRWGMMDLFGDWPERVSTNMGDIAKKKMSDITPEDVADAIANYLFTQA